MKNIHSVIIYYFIMMHNCLNKSLRRFNFNNKARMSMYRMLEKMTSEPASLQINDAIKELQALEEHNQFKSSLWYIYADILEKISNSEASFADAAMQYIPKQDAMIIAASEQDDITIGFKTVIDNNLKLSQMKNAFITALSYPIFLIILLLGIVYYFSVSVVRAITQNSPAEAKLSTISSILKIISDSFYIWFPITSILIFGVIVFCIWSLPNLLGNFRLKLESLPPYNMYKIMLGCSFLCALNSLSNAGFMQIDALRYMLNAANPYLKHRINVILNLMTEGFDVGQALIYSGLNFPNQNMIKELAIQFKYSQESSLDVIANNLTEDGLQLIKSQAKILNLIITAFVFLSIGFLYVGIYALGNDLGNINTGI